MNKKRNTKYTGNMEIERKYQGLYFLGFVAFLYLLLFLFQPEGIQKAFKTSGTMFVHLLPVFLFIICLMAIMNYFIKPKSVSRHVGTDSGVKGWLLAIGTGILSHGPIYAWYPLLRDLRTQGMKISLISVFLYSRAIKIPLLPLLAFYFGMPFVIILTGYMVIASIVQGLIVQLIEG